MTKKQGKFFTDSEGRVRYIGNDRKKKDAGGAQVTKTETAPQRGQKGQFITKDGRVIFVGGPGGGGGTAGGGSGSISSSQVDVTATGWGGTSIADKIVDEGDFTHALDEYQTRKYGAAPTTNIIDHQSYLNMRGNNMIDDMIELLSVIKQQS